MQGSCHRAEQFLLLQSMALYHTTLDCFQTGGRNNSNKEREGAQGSWNQPRVTLSETAVVAAAAAAATVAQKDLFVIYNCFPFCLWLWTERGGRFSILRVPTYVLWVCRQLYIMFCFTTDGVHERVGSRKGRQFVRPFIFVFGAFPDSAESERQ